MPDEKLRFLLEGLDQSLGGSSQGEVQMWADQFNAHMKFIELMKPPRSGPSKGEQIAKDLGMDFVADVIREKGLRLKFLEDAVHADKIVLKGSINVKANFLEALQGKEPFQVRIGGGTLRLEVLF
jgi:hypothetical protein